MLFSIYISFVFRRMFKCVEQGCVTLIENNYVNRINPMAFYAFSVYFYITL